MNLIFDGNYLFYKTLFVVGGYGKGSKVLEDKDEQDMFIRKIATDMSYAIRTFGKPDRVILTIDSRSWRKDIVVEEADYKGHRVKDDTIDWDSFYKCMNEFAAHLERRGVIVSREERAEGDDLMYLWADRLYETGQDAIIITGDKDLTQCVRWDGKNFIVVYNSNSKSRKIVAPQGFASWLKKEDYDIFDASTYMNRGKDLIAEAASSVTVEEIDPKYVIFEKVICGDAGDNVPPIFTWLQKEKTFRITPAKASRLYEVLNNNVFVDDVFDLPVRSNEISASINGICKQTSFPEGIKKRLEQNLQLVYLDKRIIPTDIQTAFEKSFNQDILKRPAFKDYNMSELLEGTRFLKDQSRTFEADIFSKFK